MAHLIVKSIGAANFTDCVAFAEFAQVSGAAIIKSIYQAPCSIGAEAETARQAAMLDFLRGRRFEAELSASEPDGQARLVDVAGVMDVRGDVMPALNVLSAFTGVTRDDMLAMLLKPPGLILGDVSAATADALDRRLQDLPVRLMVSGKENSLYDLFLASPDHVMRRAVEGILGFRVDNMHGAAPAARQLSFAQASALWRQLGHHQGLTLINQDFQTWDLWLEAIPSDRGAVELLSEVTEVPLKACERIVRHLPVVISSGVSPAEMHRLKEGLVAASFTVRAELTTIRRFTVTLREWADPAACAALLSGFGIEVNKLQWTRRQPLPLPESLPDVAARLLQSLLKRIQCNAELEVVES
jgi:hypothetical protein